MPVGIIFNDEIEIVADRYDYHSRIFTYEGTINNSDETFQRYHDYITNNTNLDNLVVVEDNGTRRIIGGNGIIGEHNFDFSNEGNVTFSGRIDF